ncbi:MAG: FMN-binding negative transcriptional regulator [Betaproteobacteria bacterium]|nr:MAG: FMN-binding negative transcriptional regulator [Betaproteobacteria bacterium]
MYVPRSFEENDTEVLHGFIARHPLATLVTMDGDELCADHIPMLLSRTGGGDKVLQGHVARGNPLWRRIGAYTNVLAVFQDPGLYITPSWYASKAETHKVVPTWNYIAVHASGHARIVDDPSWLRAFLGRLTHANESHRTQPWQLADAPADYITSQLKAIVGIEISVARLVGKWKVSQNRLPKDIDGVVTGLLAQGDPDAVRIAGAVSERRPGT